MPDFSGNILNNLDKSVSISESSSEESKIDESKIEDNKKSS